jgi:hypothetical protein
MPDRVQAARFGRKGFKAELDGLWERETEVLCLLDLADHVELAVYCDETAFDTLAGIVARVPGPGDGGGQVCVTGVGGLTWTRDYQSEASALTSAPEGCGQAADPASIVGSVVEAVTRVMSLLRPAGTGRAAHG